MKRRIIGNVLIIAIVFTIALLTSTNNPRVELALDTPSPALGRVLATAVHQTLSDPYFLPLEKLTSYLDRHQGMSSVSVDMLTKWAPDNEFPTCFVWNTDGSKFQLDKGTDEEVINEIVQYLNECLNKVNPNQLLYLKYLRVRGEKYWLGFIRIPLGSSQPTQMAGAFFSMNRYLEQDVPRLMNEMLDRPRFPLATFQADSKLLGELPGSHLSLRILKENGEVYFQRGRSFDPKQLIYAESKYFPKPIVAMMENWDIEIFSDNIENTRQSSWIFMHWLVFSLAGVALSIIWWIGTKPAYQLIRINPAINRNTPQPDRGIRLDQNQNQNDELN